MSHVSRFVENEIFKRIITLNYIAVKIMQDIPVICGFRGLL